MTIKKSLLPILLVFSFITASAQIGESRSELCVGVTAGANINNVDFDPTIKQSGLVGFTGGVAMRYTCEKYFSTICAIQIELNYAHMGWKEKIMNNAGEKLPDKYQRNMNYIQMPFLARLGWGREERGLMFFVLAGPQVGYNFSSSSSKSSQWTLNAEGNPDRPNNMYQQYDMKVKHKIDYGITGGLGLEVNTAKLGHFTLEGRYYYGLGDIFGNSKKDVFSRSANGTFIFKLGYFVTLLKR